MSKGSMRDQMPRIAAAIDELRGKFGRDNVDQLIRRGMRGEPVFYAVEAGQCIGTPLVQPRARAVIKGAQGAGVAAEELVLEFGDFMNWETK
jgi:hypothetical protein